MKFYRILTSALLLAGCLCMQAETPKESKLPSFRELNMFNKLDVGVTVGTTGLGLELGTPLTKWAQLRVGAGFLPHVGLPMHFGLMTYTEGTSVNNGNFGKIKDMMYKISGYEMDDVVDVDAVPKMWNLKFLVDVYPIPDNHHWRVTGGVFVGNNTLGTARNTMEEMPTLLAMNMYNRMYDTFMSDYFFDNPLFGDIYMDPVIIDEVKEHMEEYGKMGVHIGDFKDGKPYFMEADKDGTVSARALVNKVRWYAGLGYETTVSKDKRWKIGVDLGAMFWGGAPTVYAHDGVNMSDDLVNIRGSVGDYMDLMNNLKVYPTLEFKIGYTFF